MWVVNCFHFSVSLGYTTTSCLGGVVSSKLWIAFIFQYLWDTQQQNNRFWKEGISCELLSFFSIFGIHNNAQCLASCKKLVVNCFHFSVSLGYTTTVFPQHCNNLLLWIAFIFQYLWDTQQRSSKSPILSPGCELLSFFSIFGIHNNYQNYKICQSSVVNCFHFSVSLGYTTTFLLYSSSKLMLWIAFIFQYLWDTQQHYKSTNPSFACCELLSFFSIFGIHNNFINW